MKSITRSVFLFLLLIKTLFAASISTDVDINPVFLNDSFHITYTASGKVDGIPDFNPIKKHFEILGTQQSNNITMVNGEFQRSSTWTLSLIAKTTGSFTIPAVSFGADLAPKVNIVVKDVAISNSATPAQDFIVEIEASKKAAFTQQQVIITTRLLVSKSISSYQFNELTTSDPNAQIVALSNGTQYKTYKGKKQFIAIERKYALYPSEPGELKVKPIIAEVAMTSRSSSGRFFDPFNSRATTKRFSSKPVTLKIKKIPSIYKENNWLPGTSVKLKEQWPNNKKFIAGEPITRTITLTAEGLMSSQLAEIKQEKTEGLKQYPDKPILQDNKTESGITSSLKQKFAYIPAQAGNYTLPEITVPWWNVKTKKIEITRITARKFTVEPPKQNNLNQTPTNKQVTAKNDNAHSTNINIVENSDNSSSVWFWISLLFLILWLITLFLWWNLKANKTGHNEKTEPLSLSISESLKNLKLACDNNNAKGTKSALLNWAEYVFPEKQIINLSDLARQLDKPLSQKIEDLNTYLYGATKSEWLCGDIYNRLKNYKPAQLEKNKKPNSAELEAFRYD